MVRKENQKNDGVIAESVAGQGAMTEVMKGDEDKARKTILAGASANPEKGSFENPLDRLKRVLHYEPARFNEDAQTLTVGDKKYVGCEKMDVAGIQSTKYSATDKLGRAVIIKIRKGFSEQDVISTQTSKETKWGESEEIVSLSADEAVLGLMADCETGKKARPDLLSHGKLPDGRYLIVEERISGEDPVGSLYDLKYSFVSRFLKYEESDVEGQKKLQKEADLLKTSLLLMFRDSMSTFKAMLETGVYSKDLKMVDYIIESAPLEDLETPQKLEAEWRGVFVDWGIATVRTDKAERPLAEKKDLFFDSMRNFLHGNGKGVYDNFFLQRPRLSDEKEADRETGSKKVRLLKLIETFAEVKDPLDELLNFLEQESATPQGNFSEQGEKIFAKLTAVAESLGLKMKFEFPL